MRLHPYAPFGILVAVTIGGVALTNILEKTHNSMKAKPATPSIIKVTPKPVAKVIQFEAASGISTHKNYGGEMFKAKANDTKFITVRKNGLVEEVLIAYPTYTHWNVDSCKQGRYYAKWSMFSKWTGALPVQENLEGKNARIPLRDSREPNYCHIVYNKDGAVSAVSFTPNKTELNPISAVSDVKRCRVLDTCVLYSVKTRWVQAYNKNFTLSRFELAVLIDNHAAISPRRNVWPTDVGEITEECNKGEKSSCEYLKGYTLAYDAHQSVSIRPPDFEYHKQELINKCHDRWRAACDELETMGIRYCNPIWPECPIKYDD